MKIKKIILVIGMFLITVSISNAQLNISGEFRPRTEYSHGYKTLAGNNQSASLFTSQRTRLNFTYKSDDIITKFVLQDVRTWGNQKQLVGNEDFSASVHEAWAEVFFNDKISLKAGRQELVYDDHRIFGNVGWAQQARSHDVALLKYKGDINIHFGLAYNENTDRTNNIYEGPDAYKALQFIWLNKKSDKLNLSFLFLNNGSAFNNEVDTTGNILSQGIVFSQTVGPRIEYKTGKLLFSGNFYFQAGKDAGNKKLSAHEYAINISVKATEKLSLNGGYEKLSGTDFDETEENNSFTPFFGTNHKFNGFMDYFYVGNHANNVGLQDLYLKAKYAVKKVFIGTDLHIFSAAAKIDASDDKSLGTEIDITAGYNISKSASLKIGYSQMYASDSMQTLKGGIKTAQQNWGWLMLTVKPTFL